MKEKRVVLRNCVVTKEQLEKKDLLRIVRKDGIVSVDKTGKANGRGAYIKKDLEVLELAKKTKALDRALGTEIPEEVYDEIEKTIKKNKLED